VAVTPKLKAFWTDLGDAGAQRAYYNVLDWLQRLPIDDVREKITAQAQAVDERRAAYRTSKGRTT
jgi:hypothetical protein